MAAYTLRFRVVDKATFVAIQDGGKKIETRAATEKYKDVKKGDLLVFVCGSKRFERTVKKAEHFSSIGAILKKYKPQELNPKNKTPADTRAMYASFPGYIEKIKKHGLIALILR